MDGWDVTRCVTADRRRARSGHRAHRPRHGGDYDKAIAAGCDDYDTKPVELDRLIGKIERLLGNLKAR